MDDWTGGAVYEMPPEALAQVRTPFAAVERLWVAHDDTFVYFRARFARARPLTDETQSGFPEGYWDNRRYIVLDFTGDGRADYRTNQIRSAEAGLNRTYVVDLSGEMVFPHGDGLRVLSG